MPTLNILVPSRSNRWHIIAMMIAMAYCIVAGLSYVGYPGTLMPFLAFQVSLMSMVLLAIPKPRIYAYNFFAVLLFLGFWFKWTIHALIGHDYIEPTGYFDFSGDAWDRALLFSAAGAFGTLVPRLIHLLMSNRQADTSDVSLARQSVPGWYPPWRKAIWCIGLAWLAGLLVLNWYTQFSCVGMVPLVPVPRIISALGSGTLHYIMPLILATIGYWEIQRTGGVPRFLILVPMVIGIAISISTLGRALYLMQTIPFLIALPWQRSSRRSVAVVLLLFFIGGGMAAVGTNMARRALYSQRAGIVVSDGLSRSLVLLLAERWLGMEGVLAVTSYPNTGMPLFREALHEDRREVVNSLYQKISLSKIRQYPGLLFSTAAGPIAVLAYTDSPLFVFTGMFVFCAGLILMELFIQRVTSNALLKAAVAITSSFYLWNLSSIHRTSIVFFEIWAAVLVISVVTNIQLKSVFRKVRSTDVGLNTRGV